MMDVRSLEQLWNSDEIKDKIVFYRKIADSPYLLQFSNIREMAEARVFEFNVTENKNYEIVAVIPTAKVEKEINRRLVEYFSPFPILFVESNGVYFNYSRSVNKGVNKAMSYNPSWILVCNDDILPLGELSSLTKELENVRDSQILTVSNSESHYHGEEFVVMKSGLYSLLLEILYNLISKKIERAKFNILLSRFILKNVKYEVRVFNSAFWRISMFRKLFLNFFASKILFSDILINFADFGIFMPEFLKSNEFDSNFINGAEDFDLVIKARFDEKCVKKLNFEVSSVGGQSLNTNSDSYYFKQLLNRAYLSEKIGIYIKNYNVK